MRDLVGWQSCVRLNPDKAQEGIINRNGGSKQYLEGGKVKKGPKKPLQKLENVQWN